MSSPLGDARVDLYRSSHDPAPINTLTRTQALVSIRDGTYRQPLERLRRLLFSRGRRA